MGITTWTLASRNMLTCGQSHPAGQSLPGQAPPGAGSQSVPAQHKPCVNDSATRQSRHWKHGMRAQRFTAQCKHNISTAGRAQRTHLLQCEAGQVVHVDGLEHVHGLAVHL